MRKPMPMSFWSIVIGSQTGGIRQLAEQTTFIGDDGITLELGINKAAAALVEAFGDKLAEFCNIKIMFTFHKG